MKIKVTFFPGNEKKDAKLESGATSLELLKSLSLHPDSHIVTRDNTPIPIDEKLSDGDELRIIGVVSGG